MTIRRALTLKTGTFSRFQFGDSEREDMSNYRKDIKKLSKQEQAHQGNYTNIETEVKNMDTYFGDFEKELGLVEEKLDILSEWHLSKEHHGATEIAEDCRSAISQLWIQFYKLSEAYKKQEASHEVFFNRNVENLLGELKKYDDECTERHGEAPDWLLFSFLDRAIKENNLSNGINHTTASTWTYLRSLVVADLRKRGLLK